MKRLTSSICLVLIVLGCGMEGRAQRQSQKIEIKKYELIVYVCDIEGNAVAGIVVSNKGKSSPSQPSDGSGRTILILQGEVTPGEELDVVLLVDVKENDSWEIIPNYRPLIHAFNNNPNAHTTLVVKPKKAGSRSTLADALAAKEESLELANLYIQLGNSEYANRRYDAAISAYKRALERRPNHDEVMYYLSLSLLQLNAYKDAMPYIEKCLEIRSAKPESIDLASTFEIHAFALNGLGRASEAEKENARARSIRSRLPKQDDKP